MSEDTTAPSGLGRPDQEGLALRWAARTDEGQIRQENEDAYLAQTGLWVVADGMGGHQAGEVASALAIEAVQTGGADGLTDASQLAALVRDANQRIRAASLDDRSRQGMGTTITALAVLNDEAPTSGLALVNVGDSRTYLLRRGRLRRLTVDHSYVQELVNDGQITDEEARLHPRRNIVTRALGIDDDVDVDTWTLSACRGDRYLLCSDGLVDEVPDHEIADVLSGVPEVDDAADQLLAMALRHGGRDNVTVVVVDVVEGPPLPDDTDELETDPHWAEGIAEPDHWAADGTDPAPPDTAPPPDDTVLDPPTSQQPLLVDATPHPPISRSRRGPSLGVIAFWTLIGALLIGAFVVVAAYARTGWFVGLDGEDVVVYKGRPGGVLWFDPTVEAPTTLTTDDLSPSLLDEVEGEPTFGSKDAAIRYVNDLRDQVDALDDETTSPTTSPPRTTTPVTSTSPRTTAAPTTTRP